MGDGRWGAFGRRWAMGDGRWGGVGFWILDFGFWFGGVGACGRWIVVGGLLFDGGSGGFYFSSMGLFDAPGGAAGSCGVGAER